MNIGTIRKGKLNLITDVEGIAVGNAEDAHVRTGVTVVLPDEAAIAAVDVRGGGPGTRETDALDPDCLVDAVHGLVFSGGSVYGLDAASGAVAWLGARGRGYALGNSPLVAPVVPSAILFDLTNGGNKDWGEEPPYRALGRAACEKAERHFSLGNAGAGFGARAGLLKGGLGSASAVSEDGLKVGALIASNPFGSVVMPGSRAFWAAPYEMDGEFGGHGWPGEMSGLAARDPFDETKAALAGITPGTNTTIGVVAVNADITSAEARRLAIMAQDGLARAIRPVHAPVDGDVIFVLATGKVALGPENRAGRLAWLGSIAADCVARSVARGVYEAESLGGAASYRERYGK
ncbi:peptidase T4 [Parvibaculum sedimenti]|uniref:Peptidase T4 n=3 Tax=Parvibaculum sedimenti TaxID=2608632 RepID=A0A6N6VM96_9HYPH|nr:P1 family peptidase [Parvibaculum sedimenti]KAB7742898.1 peptidase T4 [Parvibaculum sedimenti]